jgi:hypothetical protein
MSTPTHRIDTRNFPPYEQFPQRLKLVFLPVGEMATRVLVAPRYGPFRTLHAGMQDLTPNGDGFRWSLALHAAFAVHLGWSPVLRDLLGLKRRSARLLEKAEDGVRAQMISEAIVALIFSDAYEPIRKGLEIPKNILSEIFSITSRYEVRDASEADWTLAITSGFDAWFRLHSQQGGVLDLNLDTRTIDVLPLPKHSKTSSLGDQNEKCKNGLIMRPKGLTTRPTEKIPLSRLTFLVQETKPRVSEIFLELESGGFLNIASKAEEWSHGDEGYQWHDIFHLANFGVLGWSPVMETLLMHEDKQQRKPSYEVGLRAQTMEEALVAVTLQLAWNDVRLYDGKFILQLQKWANVLTRHYPVGKQSLDTWQHWCSEAFRLWREARANGGGFIDIDIENRKVMFRPTQWSNSKG